MKKKRKRSKPDMLPEYDFRGGVRGKYAARLAEGTNVVLIAPDLLQFFPDSEAVNNALRACAQIIRSQPARRSR